MSTDSVRIYIIGYGAIGKALAVFLSGAGRIVTIVRGSMDDGSRRLQLLSVEQADGSYQEAEVEVATLSSLPALDGVIVLTSKSYGNERLSSALRGKSGTSPLVLLQNGLGVERPFVEKDFAAIYRAVLFVTSQSTGEASVRFRPVSACPLGVERGNVQQLDLIVRLLHTDSFGFRKEEDIQPVIWKKTLVNCVFNTICPLVEADNGLFFRRACALEIARRILTEGLAVAAANGIVLSLEELTESLLRISRSSDGQLISTLQDIRNHRSTELDALNFEIVRIAQGQGLGHLVPLTRLLGELTAMKAELSENGTIQMCKV